MVYYLWQNLKFCSSTSFHSTIGPNWPSIFQSQNQSRPSELKNASASAEHFRVSENQGQRYSRLCSRLFVWGIKITSTMAPFLKETWLTWRFYEICHIVHHLKLGKPAPAAWLLVGGRLSGQISLLSRLYAFRAMSCCLSFGWCWLLCLCWIEKPPFSIFGHHKFLLEKERLFDPNNLWLFTPLWHPYFSHQNVSPLQYYS